MILHICPRSVWLTAHPAGEYRADTLDSEGFIHCSDPGTVHLPATALFRGRHDLVLLVIDRSRLSAPLRWEPGEGGAAGPWFPHVYGPIPTDAVTEVHDFPSQPDGSFRLPDKLATGT